MDSVKFYIESSGGSVTLPETEVTPVFKGGFEYKLEKGKVYYEHKIKDNLKFSTKLDYEALIAFKADECAEIIVKVKRLCNGSYIDYWEGFFTMFDCKPNEDKCYIEVKPKANDAYKCFNEEGKNEHNIFGGSLVISTSIGGTYEEITCSGDVFDDLPNYPPDDSCIITGGGDPATWCLKSHSVVQYIDDYPNGQLGVVTEWETVWHREIFITDCDNGAPVTPTYGSGWQLLDDDCANSNTSTWWRCPPETTEGVILGDYNYGRTLETVLNELMSSMGCGLVVRSNFFGINPAGPSPDNIAYTFAQENLHNLTIHQKSDIKNKNATNPSTQDVWNLKPKDFWEDMAKIFNVFPKIENNVLLLEHYSFYNSDLGLDLTSEAVPKSYDYSGNENVKKEDYFWMEEVRSVFKSVPIIYDCGEEEREERVSNFSTDLIFIEDFANDEKVSNEGFVIIANGIVDGKYTIINENLPLSWVTLQENLFKHGRLYKSGSINGISQTFLNWKPYIKGDKFKFKKCCSTDFDPEDIVTTVLGEGSVSSAEENIYTSYIELELNY